MHFEHDKEAKAVYVSVSNKKVVRTKELSRNFLVDLDRKGNIIGVEILGAKAVPRSKKVRVLLDLKRVTA